MNQFSHNHNSYVYMYISLGVPGSKRRGGGVLCHLHSAECSYQFRPHPGPERGTSLHNDA